MRWGYVITAIVSLVVIYFLAGFVGIGVAIFAYLFGAIQAITHFRPNYRWF